LPVLLLFCLNPHIKIEGFGEDKVIGNEISEFVWEFHNWTISFFAIEIMGIMSDIRYLEGGKGIMEEVP